MIQMMLSTIGGATTGGATAGGSSAARGAQHRQALMLRKLAGFAIVSSGLAVIVVQAVQHALGA